MVYEINDNDDFIKIIKDKKLVVIDFFSNHCAPCKMIAPLFEKLESNYKSVSFCKINVQNTELDTACSICEIVSLPSFCFFKEGKCLAKFVGANISDIEACIKKHI